MILPRGLIVSCQAYEGEPMFGPENMAAMAKAAEAGGAIGIRANSPVDIQAIRRISALPIIGIYKVYSEDSDVYITPDIASAQAIAEAGCDIVAVDSTLRPRPQNNDLSELYDFIRNSLKKAIMADISNRTEAVNAQALGVDYISTTLAGYTTPSQSANNGPDLELVAEIVKSVHIPVIAEGRYHEPYQAAKAIQYGAHAVVVGEAITRPEKITERFVSAVNT